MTGISVTFSQCALLFSEEKNALAIENENGTETTHHLRLPVHDRGRLSGLLNA